MNWDEVKGKWTEMKGHVKERWADLTDDDLLAIEGERDKLVGKIQHRYGVTKEEAERQIDEYEKS
ncbi:CsbD family protein [Thiorhodococcus fuscus]|uniref:CsbD family protein n=1 Tax=Thiorhodococcus fuscus TaxID=527200 RepID=A0ABW4Y6L9_9GAMM